MRSFVAQTIRVTIEAGSQIQIIGFQIQQVGLRFLACMVNPIAQHPLPYSFIVLTHTKVKQMTSNDLAIPLWQ